MRDHVGLEPLESLTAATRFRRPLREPVESFDIPHPALPAALDGLTILHLSDLHIRRFHPARPRFRTLLAAIDDLEPDIVAFTGDLMDEPGNEHATLQTLAAIESVLHPRLGAFGTFGNHDSPDLQRLAARDLPTIHWFTPETPPVFETTFNATPMRILGLSWPEDPLSAMLQMLPKGGGAEALRGGGGYTTPSSARLTADKPTNPSTQRSQSGHKGLKEQAQVSAQTSLTGSLSHAITPPPHPFPFTLSHYPATIIPAAELGLPLLLSGHTHAGQIRVSSRLAPHTSSDIPPHLATGVLRLRTTLMCISRGLGEGVIENLRLNCPWQAPLYTLRRAPLPDVPRSGSEQTVTQVMAW